MREKLPDTAEIAVIGGSGVYKMEGLENLREVRVDTPYGPPSDAFLLGRLSDRDVAFLPRHGRDHTLLPHEINSRANIWAMKKLGVKWVLAFSAVGSLREEIAPRDVVVPDQILDRTVRGPSTFFGDGIVAHVSFADPFCPLLREVALQSCRRLKLRVHDGGTYICMEGPAFSTRAESAFHRAQGFSVIGMTAMPEAKLAREAELAYVTIALATDYDVWHEAEEAVTVELVLENLRANAEHVRELIRIMVPAIPARPESPAHVSLTGAIMTDRSRWPAATLDRLAPLLKRVS